MKKRMLHGIGIAILTVTGTMAQNKTITGKVTLFSEIPVEKAEISIAKTETRIYTDSLGFFTITYGPKDRLIASPLNLYSRTKGRVQNIPVSRTKKSLSFFWASAQKPIQSFKISLK